MLWWAVRADELMAIDDCLAQVQLCRNGCHGDETKRYGDGDTQTVDACGEQSVKGYSAQRSALVLWHAVASSLWPGTKQRSGAGAVLHELPASDADGSDTAEPQAEQGQRPQRPGRG